MNVPQRVFVGEMSTAHTHGNIEIEAFAQYMEDQSDPSSKRFVFAYRIRIRNAGEAPAKLMDRHWIITDADGEVQEVRGEGVVGEQPVIQPGQTYEYSSGCAIPTPFGSMSGSYGMTDLAGHRFEAAIPEFFLAGPRVLH